jgi:hypothetical protein
MGIVERRCFFVVVIFTCCVKLSPTTQACRIAWPYPNSKTDKSTEQQSSDQIRSREIGGVCWLVRGCGCGCEDGGVRATLQADLSHKGSPSAMETWWNTSCL